MAGLETIALAVAHLEREGDTTEPLKAASSWVKKTKDEVSFRAKESSLKDASEARSGSMVDSRLVTPSLPASFALPPPRRSFEDAPRRVSNDSTGPEDPASYSELSSPRGSISPAVQIPTSASPPPLAFPHDLSSCLTEPERPLPPPPSPSEIITQVMESDVLCGRGGETNHHPGNVKYRALVKRFQLLYIVSKRRDKPRIAEQIVRTVRLCGGRFLKKDSNSNSWKDVGNIKAREKTSQALREGAPELRSTGPKGKEEQADQVAQPVTGNDCSNANMVVSSNALPTATQSVPTIIVETEPCDGVGFGFASPSSPKRRRLHMPEFPPASSVSAMPRPAPVVGGMVPPFPHGQPHFNRGCFMSPAAFSATVSADDEDIRQGDQQQEQSATHQPVCARGPRLKLLKKRLQHETN